MDSRLRKIRNEIDANRVCFVGINVLIEGIVDANDDLLNESEKKQKTIVQFCKLASEEFLHLFSTIGSKYKDEIDAHMNMFDTKNEEYYEILIKRTTDFIQKSVSIQ